MAHAPDPALIAQEWDVFNLFAGPGGWSEGILPLRYRELGIEWHPAAAETATAAGHARLLADVALLNPGDFTLVGTRGQIASPPCQGFSTMGKGKSRHDSVLMLDAIAALALNPTAEHVEELIAELRSEMTDTRSILVLEPLRWLLHQRPRWVAWEQVPNVLPLWEACAPVLLALGYTVETGVLSSEQFGVAQTRRRAFLVGRSPEMTATHGPARLPQATHSRFYPRTPDKLDRGLLAPVTMGEALAAAQKARHARGAVDSPFWVPDFNDQSGTPFDPRWPFARPSTAVAGRGLVMNPGANANRFNGSTKSRNDGVKIEPWQAGVLQSFREDYPWSGNRTEQFQQAGDVVCPAVALAMISEVAANVTRHVPQTQPVLVPALSVQPAEYGEQDVLDIDFGVA